MAMSCVRIESESDSVPETGLLECVVCVAVSSRARQRSGDVRTLDLETECTDNLRRISCGVGGGADGDISIQT